MKPILLLTIPILASVTNFNTPNILFPTILEDKRCFADIKPNSGLYQRWTMSFDRDGFRTTGNAYYSDNGCSNLLEYRSSPFTSKYSYKIGEEVNNADGSKGTKLIYPNPETNTPYGTVFLYKSNEICFAKGTISVSQNSFGFAPTSVNGDFSGQGIDTQNCWHIIE